MAKRRTPPVEVRHWRFNVNEYHRMGEVGLLDEDSRVELIEGELIEMSPIGIRHAWRVTQLTQLFIVRLAGRAHVSPQNPIRLNFFTEPQPDFVLLRPDFDGSRIPTPEDTLLLVEVSDTTLRYDRDRKAPLYSEAGVPETWIANISGDRLLVFREPGPEGYRLVQEFSRGQKVSPLALPDVAFTVDELLGTDA